jgi:hydroxymethylpyrimidine/phosphomethylpyrimidine kinase
MLASAGTIETIAATLQEYDGKAIVLDPVCHGLAKAGMPSV